MTKPTKTETIVRDPVCGMTFVQTAAVASVKHKGAKYYFDSTDCAVKFQTSPEDYLNPREVM